MAKLRILSNSTLERLYAQIRTLSPLPMEEHPHTYASISESPYHIPPSDTSISTPRQHQRTYRNRNIPAQDPSISPPLALLSRLSQRSSPPPPPFCHDRVSGADLYGFVCELVCLPARSYAAFSKSITFRMLRFPVLILTLSG